MAGFLSFLTLLFWTFTYYSAQKEFSYYDIFVILLFTLIALLAQIILLRVFESVVNNRLITRLVCSGFIMSNLFTTNLILNVDFIRSTYSFKVFAALIGLFICFSILKMMDEIPRAKFWIPIFTFLVLAGNITYHELRPHISFHQSGLASNNIRLVDFREKPNVYVIFFDSMIPKPILKKFMGIEEVSYHKILDKKFRRFKNFFVDRAPTVNSIGSFLSLDSNYYSSMVKADREGIFRGKTRSQLFDIFSHNGYETNTLYDTGYFGRDKGPYVDNYLVRKNAAVCEFVPKGLKEFTFFGYCKFGEQAFLKDSFGFFFASPPKQPKQPKQPSPTQPSSFDFLINNFRNGLSKPKPQIFVNYIFSPGHTKSIYDHKKEGHLDNYISDFKKESKHTAEFLGMLNHFIEENDPTGIFYLLGDHGPYLSRQIPRGTTVKEDKEFFVQDRYGVYGGIYPPDKCKDSFAKPYNKNYMTAIQGMHMIIRCLSGGEEAYINPDDSGSPGYRVQGDYDYADYLYE